MKELVYVFKTIWNFLTTEPQDRTDEEWNDIFIVGEALRQTRKLSDRKRKRRSICGTGRVHSKRRYR